MDTSDLGVENAGGLGKKMCPVPEASTPFGNKVHNLREACTAVLREAWTRLPESSSRPLPAILAQTRNLAHASLETAVIALKKCHYC